MDVTEQLHGKSYQAPPINRNGMVFRVEFALRNSEKEYPPASGSDTSQQDTTGSSAVKTGDETTVIWFIMFLLLSGGFLCGSIGRKMVARKKES